MLVKSFEMQVFLKGHSAKEYGFRGNSYVEGREGSEFEILLTNNSHERVLAVLSVDGKDCITGKDCDINGSGGYVIPEFSHIKIPGWRLNNDEVAKFVFSSPEKSYAAAIDGDQKELNIGVIGCAIFRERKGIFWSGNTVDGNGIYNKGLLRGTAVLDAIGTNATYTTSSMMDVAPMAASGSVANVCDASSYTTNASYGTNAPNVLSQNSIGVGFGKKQEQKVQETNFARCSEAECSLILYYDTRDGLKAKGVPLVPTISVAPQPFPATTKRNGCLPPKNWVG